MKVSEDIKELQEYIDEIWSIVKSEAELQIPSKSIEHLLLTISQKLKVINFILIKHENIQEHIRFSEKL